jgi:hypothetical protein
MVVTVIDEFDSERVLQDVPRRLEPDTMLGVVRSGFLIVPLKAAVFLSDTAAP